MGWNDDLLDDQRVAVKHGSTHARLIAGPGTGKTYVLTGRVVDLVQVRGVPAKEILILTFTRAAAQELRERIASALGDLADQPQISTLHSFALRQLVKNGSSLASLPQPIRIADDWEERKVAQEDLKRILKRKVKDVQKAFHEMSADWEQLVEPPLERDPVFIGAWRQHREVFGYTLRSELVYELKKALEQIGGFTLDGPLQHVLVDEYQDLNKCDLAIISALAERGATLFVAGDDDQSIYGFRKAHPEGIRQFPEQHVGSTSLELTVCKRCDPNILELATFVAKLDPKRLPKNLHPEDGRQDGELTLVRCSNQYEEADCVARACWRLIHERAFEPHDILILMRSDRNQAFSKPLLEALRGAGVPVIAASDDPLDAPDVRLVLAALRLSLSPDDSLAWRAVLTQRNNGIGEASITAVYDMAVKTSSRFAAALSALADAPATIPKFGTRLASEVAMIRVLATVVGALEQECKNQANDLATRAKFLRAAIDVVAKAVLPSSTESVVDLLASMAGALGASSIAELFSAIETLRDAEEQAVVRGSVNLLTMHRAKGLTSKAVFVVAAEDEHIPGRQQGEDEIGDERRLLYVSLTRAKHFLCITYCERRIEQQQNLGVKPGNPSRRLTRFLSDAGLAPEVPAKYPIMAPL